MRANWDVPPYCHTASNDVQVEAAGGQNGQLLYIDEQHLTRDCIGHALARHLPDLSIVVRSEVQDIQLNGSEEGKFKAVILNVHANRIDNTDDREILDKSRIISELSLLEQTAPDTPRILLSDVEVPEDIIEAFRRRIRGYVPTTLPIGQLAEAIRFVLAGGTFVPQSILTMSGRSDAAMDDRPKAGVPTVLANFSPRQNEVLSRLWLGLSNKMIAYELSMCESTVKVHIRHIMKKLNVNNRTQIVLRTRPPALDTSVQHNRRDLPRPLQIPALASPIPTNRSGVGGHANIILGHQDAARGRTGSQRP
jgi:DNA-binding NarL/FixJ family response regulator